VYSSTILARLLLFFSSYIPLIIIFSIRCFDINRVLSISGFIVSLVLFLILVYIMFVLRKLSVVNLTVKKVSVKSSDLLAYMFSYILPFLGLHLDNPLEVISVIIFFSMLAIVYVNSNMIYINPMLSILGYRIYEVTDANDNVYVLITKQKSIIVGTELNARRIGGNVLLD